MATKAQGHKGSQELTVSTLYFVNLGVFVFVWQEMTI